ncbi:diguanylate cyclase [Kordiimonas sp.]|uniref:GGDEF domain-containing response regulator n=1 Tax=Kordiimonas sp. TaxID=1970157 RepID=UPI003A8F4394
MSATEKILVIDDSPVILELLKKIIGGMADVITAPNGKIGLIKALESKPKLIVLDIRLPDIDGLKMCRAIKADHRTKHIPVILITGEETTEEAESDGFAAGAADYICKPLKPAVVQARIKTQLDLYLRAEALVKANSELQRMVSIDMLTTCLNRHYFLGIADAELSRMRRHGYAVTVAMLDIDHFKAINDTYGHAAGDDVLRAVGACMKECVRHEDSVGRMGGEEFAILLPVSDADGAMTVLDRMRERLAALSFDFAGRSFGMTVSLGIAEVFESDLKIEDALKRADKALYQAKEGGRNRIVVA